MRTSHENVSFAVPLRHLLLGMILVALASLGSTATTTAQDLEEIGRTNPITLGGSLSIRGLAYGINGISPRRSPFSYVLSGALNLNVYDLSFPFSFTLSDQDRSLSQPFNQFGASPRYKWLTAHLGYRNLTFSPFTLAGHQILGAGVELTPGQFRLGFITGRFSRAVEGDTASLNAAPAYERNGFSGRIGYGSEANHLDLIVLKAGDDTNSLKTTPSDFDLRPAENLVVGAGARFTPVQGLSLHADVAVSDYTRDIRSDKLDLNTDISVLGDVVPPRASTQIYTAVTAGLALNIETFNLQASYSRIDPDYQSMGAYYLQNDLESLTLTPSISLFDYKLYVNAGLTIQHDNVQGKKRATTQRLSPSLALSYSPSTSFGINVQAADVITTQSPGNQPLNDSTRMEQSIPTLTISPRYSIDDSIAAHSFYAVLNYTGLLDDNPITSTYTEYTNTNIDLSYNLSMQKAGLGLTASVGTNRYDNVGGSFHSESFSLGATKSLGGEAVNLNGSFGMSFQESARILNLGTGAAYRFAEHHTANLNLSLTTSSTSGTPSQSFTEYTAVVSYAYNF